MSINLISKIKPKNEGAFPVYEDVDIEGGYQVREDITDRNSIPALNRKIGMLVYIQEEEKYYTLIDGIDNTNWVEAQFGGGSFTPSGDLSGDGSEQIVIGLNTIPLPPTFPEPESEYDPDKAPADTDMLIARSATANYEFIKKNSYVVTNSLYVYNNPPERIDVDSRSEIILANPIGYFGIVPYILPTNPSDGQQHTFIDAEGRCNVTDYISINMEQDIGGGEIGFVEIFEISDPYGAVTIAYCSALASWHVVSYYNSGTISLSGGLILVDGMAINGPGVDS